MMIYIFEVEEAVILQSETIKHVYDSKQLPRYFYSSAHYKQDPGQGLKYCNFHVASVVEKLSADEVKNFADVVKVDPETLYDLFHAAGFLNIMNLLDLISGAFVDMLRAKTPEEIAKIFNMRNDFTLRKKTRSVGIMPGPFFDIKNDPRGRRMRGAFE